jgi:sugar transferase (PEP-CTERM/EpsH1 system associated)
VRILFVLSRVPYPLEKGDKLRAFHLIRELSKRHEIYLFCLADAEVDARAEEELKRYCTEVYIHRFRAINKLMNLARAVVSRKPFQVEYFHSPQAQQAFNAFLEEHLPQQIFCQLIRTAEYVRPYRVIPKAIDYMDAFSAGMEKMARASKWPLSVVMHEEHRRLVRYEKDVAKLFHQHYIISEQDKACLKLDVPLTVLPNGIDPLFFQSREEPKSRDLLFTGNMSYRPNVESARFLVQEVMPLLWKTHPELRLCLAGANPSAAVLALKSARVEVTGWVDDIHAVYASARIFIAPMLINSGLQNKLLEAMASGLPCITSSLANNALGARPSHEILIADHATEARDAVVKLLMDKGLSASLAAQGKAYATSTYSWEHEAQRLEASMLGQTVPTN